MPAASSLPACSEKCVRSCSPKLMLCAGKEGHVP
jgi:hypothetical protein